MNNLAFVVPIQSKRGGGGWGGEGSSSSNGWFGLLSFLFCGKKIILNTLGRIARSYEFYAGKEIFFSVPTVFALEGSIEKNCFRME